MEILSGYRGSIRYDLAKKKLDESFLRWLSLPTTTQLINKLIEESKNPNSFINYPSPHFQTRLGASSTQNLQSPKRSSLTPPLSPSAHEKFMSSHSMSLPPDALNSSPTKSKSVLAPIQLNKPQIPQFYFPKGKPIDREQEERNISLINEVFRNDTMTAEEFINITTSICELPRSVHTRLVQLISNSNTVSKGAFMRFWKGELENRSPVQRFFHILKKPENDYIERDDFNTCMKYLLEFHTGLEFLKATPEFQERYVDTVIERIFFTVDLNDDRKISLRELKKSNLLSVFCRLDEEEDINKVRDYFSYEHFYVLYCRFWELDTDHDFIIDKEDFARYEGHSLSRKVIDRIFEEVPRKFKCGLAGKMGYNDFICI